MLRTREEQSMEVVVLCISWNNLNYVAADFETFCSVSYITDIVERTIHKVHMVRYLCKLGLVGELTESFAGHENKGHYCISQHHK